MKRKIAAAFVLTVLALAGAAGFVLRTAWAGKQICALAQARVRLATGLELEVLECLVEPLRLEVSAKGIRVGSEEAPTFTADAVRARLAPVQALGRRLALAELSVERPRLTGVLRPSPKASTKETCPIPSLEGFEIQQLDVEGGVVDLTLSSGERLVAQRVDVRSAPVRRRGLDVLSVTRARRVGFEVSLVGAKLETPRRELALDAFSLAADVATDLSQLDVYLLTAEKSGASLTASGKIQQLCQPELDLMVSVRGSIAPIFALAGRPLPLAEGTVTADVTVSGSALQPAIAGELKLGGVSIDRWRLGDAVADVRFARSELRVDRLELPTQGGRVVAHGTVRFERQVRLEADAELQQVELGELLDRLRIPGAWVMGRVTGTAHASGTLAPVQLAGEAGLDLIDFRVMDHRWEKYRPGERLILELRRARLDAPVQIDATGLHLDSAHVRAGAGHLTTSGTLFFRGAQGFELACEGPVDLSEIGHVASVEIGGMAELEGGVIRAAPYGIPTVTGRVRGQEIRFLKIDLGRVNAMVSYDDVLRFAEARGRRGATDYEAEIAVDLRQSPPELTEASYAVKGRLRDLFEASLLWQPNAVILRDNLDGDVEARGTASGPTSALDILFEGELGTGSVMGRSFDSGSFAGRVAASERVVFDRAELRGGRGTLRGGGWIGFEDGMPWGLQLAGKDVPLARLRLPGGGWQGSATGKASLEGSLDEPRVEFTVDGGDVVAAEVPIGPVRLTGRHDQRKLQIDGELPGIRFSGTGSTRGEARFEARAQLDIEDALRFVPGGPPAGLRARVRGEATASGRLTDPAGSRASLRLDEIQGGFAEFEVQNSGPVVVELERRRIDVKTMVLRGVNTQLAVTGHRDLEGALSLDARGGVDLRLLGGLLPGVSDPRGQLQLEAHVGGTLSDPVLVGAGRFLEAGFRMRDAPIAISGMTGGVTFSQNRMLFDDLAALANGGQAQFSGEIELVRFFPARVRMSADVDEVPVRIPESLPSVVSGRLQAAGTWDSMLLSGKLRVLRALYSSPVDLERRLIDVQRTVRPPSPPDRSGEWLSFDIALVVDGDARIENDLVRGSFLGDLTLTGTLAHLGMIGTLTLQHGGRATFRGNEFGLTHGVIDFGDRRKIKMGLDVHGDASVQDYQVFMHLYGPYDDPKLQLTSQPALSQQDIVTLLSLGYTTRDTAVASGVTGLATAAAAQALFSASGLDEQVRRFVPRSGFLRDFSVRITSAYSDVLGQVEPRAEFESKLIDDRFRLRYQAPLAGSRGQRAQAEMRLSERFSIQYQWDNENPDISTAGGDHGLDLKLRWEWND